MRCYGEAQPVPSRTRHEGHGAASPAVPDENASLPGSTTARIVMLGRNTRLLTFQGRTAGTPALDGALSGDGLLFRARARPLSLTLQRKLGPAGTATMRQGPSASSLGVALRTVSSPTRFRLFRNISPRGGVPLALCARLNRERERERELRSWK